MYDSESIALDLASTVMDELNGYFGHAGGVPVNVSASLLGGQKIPNERQANQLLEVFLTKI